MKHLTKIPLLALAALLSFSACSDDDTAESAPNFGLDASDIEQTIGPDGGDRTLHITSAGRWSVVTDASWVRVAPSSGRGPAECTVQIDSAVMAGGMRTALVQVVSEDQTLPLDFRVSQEGYERFIEVLDEDIEVPNYGEYGKRTFDVRVKTNVPFTVKIPAEKRWVFHETQQIGDILNRGARPRVITLRFTWDNNSRPEERETEVELTPDTEGEGAPLEPQRFSIRQGAAEEIVPGVKGDSLTIIAIYRSMNSDVHPDFTEKMANWPGVTLWEATDDEVEEHPELLGRVRKFQIKFVYTQEDIPFEFQYLTAAEEISVYSSANKSQKSLSTGPYICMLEQLKSLQIFSFGLVELHEDFTKLKNLEVLDLSGNNFNEIPAILTPENFPKLKYLDLSGNRRASVLGNLDETPRDPEEWGGLWKTPMTGYNGQNVQNLLKWENLEYLNLSNNYMQGTLPNITKYTAGFPKWQAGDQYRYRWDSKKIDPETGKKGVWEMHDIPAQLVGQPKILPNATRFSVNLNYLNGRLPDWVLYHPMLLRWAPETLIFNQERWNDKNGRISGFTNVPENPDYYYEWYPEQIPDEIE